MQCCGAVAIYVVTMNSAKETLEDPNVARRSDRTHSTLEDPNVARRSDRTHSTFITELNLVRPSVLVSVLLVGSWGNVSQTRPSAGTWSVRWDMRPGQ
jgi:hypothetical protein